MFDEERASATDACPPTGRVARWRALVRADDAELRCFVRQRGPLHVQADCGPLLSTYHPVGSAEDTHDVLALHVTKSHRHLFPPRVTSHGFELKIAQRDLKRPARREDDGAFEDVCTSRMFPGWIGTSTRGGALRLLVMDGTRAQAILISASSAKCRPDTPRVQRVLSS